MNVNVDIERLRLAHKTVYAELLAERAANGRWVGHVSSSPIATAAAISALVVAHRQAMLPLPESTSPTEKQPGDANESAIDVLVHGQLSELVVASLHWLARVQNADGGWGDCPTGRSNLPATALVQAAFRLTGVPAKYVDLMASAAHYTAAQGGISEIRRSASADVTLAAGVLVNCALAGMTPWRFVPTLPFEAMGDEPPWWRRFDVWSSPATETTPETIAAQIAVGLAKYHFQPTRNPITHLARRGAQFRSLKLIEKWQAADGSFGGSPLWTAMVVMCLTGVGHREHAMVERGMEYLLANVRNDASWPIVDNLATHNTCLAVNCMAAEAANRSPDEHTAEQDEPLLSTSLDWLLAAQHSVASRGSEQVSAGGWAWNDSPGAIVNVGDTAGVLLTLARTRWHVGTHQSDPLHAAVERGLTWLLDQQRKDGGWIACGDEDGARRDGGDGTEPTSDALRAIAAWLRVRQFEAAHPSATSDGDVLDGRLRTAADRGLAWLAARQRDDGSFGTCTFGNERQPDGTNPVYGTTRVLAACAALGQLESEWARRAAGWLVRAQHVSGGWGPPRPPLDYSASFRDGSRSWRASESLAKWCSVEETAWAVAALLPLAEGDSACAAAVANGLNWLMEAIEMDLHRRPAVVGVWRGRFWYDERLYPLVFAASALSRAIRELVTPQSAATVTA